MAVSTIKVPNTQTVGLNLNVLPSGTEDNNAGSNLYVCGKIAMLKLNLKTTATNPVQIPSGFVPQGYRPVTSTQNDISDGSASGISNVRVNTDGSCTIYFGNTKYAQGTLIYLIA